jgi:hypothetical protein
MLRKSIGCGAALACGLLALAGLSASAGDKKDDKDKPAPAGVWVLKEGEARIEFSDKDVLKISPHGKDEVILVLCQYAVEKEGRVKAKVTGLEGEAKEKVKELLPVGFEFSFTWNVKDDSATLDDVKGDNVEAWRSHLEGKYDRKK